jgi:RNA polymerase sigma factor (sigma-70 family)
MAYAENDSKISHLTDSGAQSRAGLVEQLFREHNEALVRFLALRLGSHQEAKDVAQEAYVRILSLHEPGAISFLRAFLFKTAANIAIDRARSQQRRFQSASARLFEELRPGPSSPEQLLGGAQELAVVQRLLGELPPKCRRALLLHRVSGLSTDEIAAQMGLSERMIRHYILRGVAYCRSGLDALSRAEGCPHGD